MTAGFEVRTPSGKLIINENFQNICYDRKVKVADLPYDGEKRFYVDPWNQKETAGQCDWRRITKTTDDLFFAIGPDFNQVVERVAPILSNEDDILRISTPKGADISNLYLYFFKKKKTTTSNFGLQVFDANGNPVYDSQMKYMKVISYGEYFVKVPTDERQYAIAFSMANITNNANGHLWSYAAWYFTRQDPFILCHYRTMEGLTASSLFNYPQSALLIDVTDY